MKDNIREGTHITAAHSNILKKNENGDWYYYHRLQDKWILTDADAIAGHELIPITFAVEAEASNAIRGANLELARSIIEDLMAGKGYEAARAFLDGPLAPEPTKLNLPPCKGTNCGCTDGYNHSPECEAELAAAMAGGRFVKE